MKLKHTFTLSPLLLAMGLQTAFAQDAEQVANVENNEEQTETIQIVGVRQTRASKGATGLTMELSETPQSISVVTSELIKNFAANNINDALKLATGVTVEEYETTRTNYTARGFDIKNTQVDGVGMPNGWGIVTGPVESYGYEEIEVIRGANGLLTGVGNAAGTINYVRKRPTNENQGEVGVTLGSYDLKRLQADYSFLLTESGSWAARVVAVSEDKESHLDVLSSDRTYFYGVIDGQLTDNSTLAAGISYQNSNTDGTMWGGLVFNNTDGTQAEWDTSASTAQEWTFWDTESTNAFVEYTYIFANDWQVKATYNQSKSEDPSELLYIYGAVDTETGLGLGTWPGSYESDFNSKIFDITAIGEYSLFGKTHELNLGASKAKSETLSYSRPPSSGFGAAPAFPYAADAIAEPVWGDKTLYSDIDMTITRYFGSTKLNITNDLFVVAGFNAINFTREGVNSSGEINNDESEVSPYIGATYAITEDINVYASYSDVYQPQEQYDYDSNFIDPTKGINYEAGIKTQWLDDRLLATFAIFAAEQNNLPIQQEGLNAAGNVYYAGFDVESEGVEMELVGHITDNLTAVIGYTNVNVEDEFGEETTEWVPENVVNYSFSYTIPNMPELTFGLGGKWQSKIKNNTYGLEQKSYLLANVFARWDIAEQLSVQANINNITDEKYIISLAQPSYYGAPLNGSVSLSYRF
ncbi:TonB-dependent siderophore receptor [Paraglaciecola marina]|uniref:TonB-dependent siderophore receptor n=1 Tax=Paraglaciecola marina TaxID=2500157 RepID=UPI0010607EFF|nr:TonB-dependent siderophore receptor [Paraglaciecola marina]